MNYILKSTALFILLSVLIQIKAQEKNIRLKILTFNIYHGATMNNDFDLSKIAQIINSVKPDLVALQEVDYKTKRAKKMDLATELAKRTGLIPLFARAMYFDKGEYGEAVLSKYTFIKTQNHALPHSAIHEPRAALEVLIELPNKDTIRFLATHLDHTEDPLDRTRQIETINKQFSLNDYPTILAGDLNANPETNEIKKLYSVWTDPCPDPDAKTYPSHQAQDRIDYIVYKPDNRWKLVKYKVICDKIASDHCAVLTVLKLIKKK